MKARSVSWAMSATLAPDSDSDKVLISGRRDGHEATQQEGDEEAR